MIVIVAHDGRATRTGPFVRCEQCCWIKFKLAGWHGGNIVCRQVGRNPVAVAEQQAAPLQPRSRPGIGQNGSQHPP
jgi:hypothetical protein